MCPSAWSSRQGLHGLTHREIGDHSDAASYLIEVAEPMLDRIRGITDEELLMSGKDRFVMKAGEHKLLYAPSVRRDGLLINGSPDM